MSAPPGSRMGTSLASASKAMFDKEIDFGGRLVVTGFGSIGQGVLPLLLRHIGMKASQVTVVKAHDDDLDVAAAFGVRSLVAPLDRHNYRDVLRPHLGPGDFLLNLSVDVSSCALITLCRELGVLYLDTCIEPWPGIYDDPSRPPGQRSNYALRESALALRHSASAQPTAVLTHGANPGLVSHFVKQALLNLAVDLGDAAQTPTSRVGWARLAQRLGVRVIHISERDTQSCQQRKSPDEFVNTWSVAGFISEGLQPAELGWGSHERHFPADAMRHKSGRRAAIYLNRPGAGTRVLSWAPSAGAFQGFLITHSESISIADYLSLGEGNEPEYRPTVHYAYHPCDDAVLSLHELAGRNWQPQQRQRLIRDEIVAGQDELGVLLMGHAGGSYWYGSQLGIDEARAACPHNSATSLQVTAAVMAGVVWAMKNPQAGIVEPEELPFTEILALCRPYLGKVVGVYGGWSPLVDRDSLFDEDIDPSDPWQFKNFRVL
jgi:homospermidine synthase